MKDRNLSLYQSKVSQRESARWAMRFRKKLNENETNDYLNGKKNPSSSLYELQISNHYRFTHLTLSFLRNKAMFSALSPSYRVIQKIYYLASEILLLLLWFVHKWGIAFHRPSMTFIEPLLEDPVGNNTTIHLPSVADLWCWGGNFSQRETRRRNANARIYRIWRAAGVPCRYREFHKWWVGFEIEVQGLVFSAGGRATTVLS